MSVFTPSPRPRIVNGVLIKECDELKRHNGLQGTNSMEDFYRALPKISPIPETDIRTEESVSPRYGFPCSHSLRQNCPNLENTHSSKHFAPERNNTSSNLESHAVHSANRQTFEPQGATLTSPSCCALSNNQNHSAVTKVDAIEKQSRLCSEIYCEGTNFTPKNVWESGDHHRIAANNSSPPNEEDCHASNNYCCRAPVQRTTNHLRYQNQGSSTPNTSEECQESVHHCTCAHPYDSSFMEDNTIYRTSNSTRLNEQMFDDSHENTEGCHTLAKAQDSCDRSVYNETAIETAHSHRSSPVLLHKSTQEFNSQNEELECEQDTGREAYKPRGAHSVVFSGYPPQRGTDSMQQKASVAQESTNLRRRMQRRKKHDFLSYLEGRGKIPLTDQEATSVAEIFNHPVMELQPDECIPLVPHYTPSLRSQAHEGNLGYPPQPVSLGKSKHTIHKMNENETQYGEDFQPYKCNAKEREAMPDWDYATVNDPSMCECKEKCAAERNEMAFANEYEDHDARRTCRESLLQHPHMTKNELEGTFAQYSNPEHCKTSVYRSCSPHKVYPQAQEEHHHHHHHPCTIRPDEEIDNFALQSKYANSRACETAYHRTNKNENMCHASECQHNQNKVTSHAENCYGDPECHENIANEDERIFSNSAGGDEQREKNFAPVGSSNCCEAEHVTEHPYSGTPDLNYKVAGDEPESHAIPCRINKSDEDALMCHIEQPCTPDKALSAPLSPNVIVTPRKRNGLDDDDAIGKHSTNKSVLDEENIEEPKGPRKHRMLILQETRETSNRQNKRNPAVKANNPHSKTGASEQQKHFQNFIPKARSPKEKADTKLTTRKSSTVAGGAQRSKKVTEQVQNPK